MNRAGKTLIPFVLATFALVSLTEAQSCTDSDTTDFPTIDYSVKGTVTNWGGSPLTDRCETSKTLLEYYCNSGGANSQTYNCPESCSDGACVTRAQEFSLTADICLSYQVNDLRCNPSNPKEIQRCYTVPNEANPYWQKYKDCLSTEKCSSGQCVPDQQSGSSPSAPSSCAAIGQNCVNTKCCDTLICSSGGVCLYGGSSGCTSGSTEACTMSNGCAGIRTCTGGSWGSCQQTNPSCGTTQPGGTTQPPCTNECSYSECVDQYTNRPCGQYDTDLCLEWGPLDDCNSRRFTCRNGQCVTGTSPCAKEGESCINTNCCSSLDLVCSSSRVCAKKTPPGPTCSVQCAEKQLQCDPSNNKQVQRCGPDPNTAGCNRWTNYLWCTGIDVCVIGQCVPPGTQPPATPSPCSTNGCTERNQLRCDPAFARVQECKQIGSCYAWADLQNCATTEVCTGGACVPKGSTACSQEGQSCSPTYPCCSNQNLVCTNSRCTKTSTPSPSPPAGPCQNPCSGADYGKTQCDTARNAVVFCGYDAIKYCYNWTIQQQCTSSQICSGGVCTAGTPPSKCPNPCTQAEKDTMACNPSNKQEILICKEDTAKKCFNWNSYYKCPDGQWCSGGKCRTGNEQFTCDDNDGSDIYKKGTVSGLTYGQPYSNDDYCLTGNTKVNEYICLAGNAPKSEPYDCPNGCNDGACVKPEVACTDRCTSMIQDSIDLVVKYDENKDGKIQYKEIEQARKDKSQNRITGYDLNIIEQLYDNKWDVGTSELFEIRLKNGWNLISSPSAPMPMDLMTSQCKIRKNAAYFYEAAKFEEVDFLEPSKGYYIYSEGDCLLRTDIAISEALSHDLQPGWNMVSSSKSWNEIKGDCERTKSIWAWDTAADDFVKVLTTEQMTATKGYWVKVKNACTITLS